MFSGIKALFTSGAIFQPPVLLGIIVGFFLAFVFGIQDIYEVYENWRFYAGILFVSYIYNFIFNCPYKGYNKGIDWGELVANIFFSALKFVFVSVLSIIFVVVLFM